MEQTQSRIELRCDPEKLRTMYFKDREDKWFFGPKTKKESIAIVIMPAVLLGSIYLSQTYKREDILFVGAMISVMLTFSFFRSYFRIKRWKQAVLSFIEDSTNTQIEFSYSEEGYAHSMNEIYMKRDWNEVQSAEIVEGEYITLYHQDVRIVLPYCCMQTEDFAVLAETIREKVKNVNQKR